MTTKEWKLFLDDERHPSDVFGTESSESHGWTVARSVSEARQLVLNQGFPNRIAWDHDLGEGDPGGNTSVDFLKWLINYALDTNYTKFPKYSIHTQNPEGRKNLMSLLRSWQKILLDDKKTTIVKLENLK